MTTKWTFALAISTLLCPIFINGCSSTRNIHLPIAEDVTPERKARNEQFLKEFAQRRSQAELHAAINYWQRGDIDYCHTSLNNILERNPEHREALLLMANSLLATEKAPNALTHIKTATLAHPNDPEVQYTMAVILEANGQPDAALAHYELAVELAPDNETYLAHYEAAIEVGGHDDQFIPNNPDDPPEVKVLAAPMDNSDKALADLQNTLADNPNDPQILIFAAVSALRSNQPDLAVKLIEEQLSSFPKSATLRQALATAYYRLGNYSATQVVLQQALSLDNSNGLSYFLMGCTLAKLEKFDDAKEYFSRAKAIDPRLRQ